jgi:hypothetical protein
LPYIALDLQGKFLWLIDNLTIQQLYSLLLLNDRHAGMDATRNLGGSVVRMVETAAGSRPPDPSSRPKGLLI